MNSCKEFNSFKVNDIVELRMGSTPTTIRKRKGRIIIKNKNLLVIRYYNTGEYLNKGEYNESFTKFDVKNMYIKKLKRRC